jgi:hypothetical protein
VVDPIGHVGGLDGDPHPEVVGPGELGSDALEAMCAFGEHLIGVLRSVADDVEDVADEVDRNSGVKEVAHRVHEDHTRTGPPVGVGECSRVDGDVEARTGSDRVTVVLVLGRSHGFQPLGEG